MICCAQRSQHLKKIIELKFSKEESQRLFYDINNIVFLKDNGSLAHSNILGPMIFLKIWNIFLSKFLRYKTKIREGRNALWDNQDDEQNKMSRCQK